MIHWAITRRSWRSHTSVNLPKMIQDAWTTLRCEKKAQKKLKQKHSVQRTTAAVTSLRPHPVSQLTTAGSHTIHTDRCLRIQGQKQSVSVWAIELRLTCRLASGLKTRASVSSPSISDSQAVLWQNAASANHAMSSPIQAHLSSPHQLPPLALEQQAKLEENFRNNRNPSDLDVVILAAEVGLSEHTVKVDDQVVRTSTSLLETEARPSG